jgi:SAM-dependent methyltransferase
MAQELTASDYQYALPDHWVLHVNQPDDPFTKLHSQYVRRAVDIVVASGARTVLEAGCGDGWNVAQFVKAGLDAAGCDWSEKAIQYAGINCPQADFYCGDVRDQGFNERFPDKFDAVVFIEVIEHIPPRDTVSALRNVLDKLKVGGTFVLTTPHINYPNDNPQHYRHFTPELLASIMEEVGGLEVVAFEPYGDVVADRQYWAKMRWFDNRCFTIKPWATRIRQAHDYSSHCSWDRAHGIIMTAKKIG